MDWAKELEHFDGRHTRMLEELAETLRGDTTQIQPLLDLVRAEEPRLQVASTWILKRAQEDGSVYGADETIQLVEFLVEEPGAPWDARLHVLQMLEHLEVPESHAKDLWAALKTSLTDSNKMVRAWSYHGLALLANAYANWRPSARKKLNEGESDEAASVRARIRNVRKRFDWA